MSRTFYDIYGSSEDFFVAAKKVRKEDLCGWSNSTETFNRCESSRSGGFYRSWQDTCRVFDECDFGKYTALTDGILDELNTVDFSEMKWKFAQQLEEGDSVDVERYLAGQEKCWNGVRRFPKKNRSVRIYINFGGNYGRSKEELAVAGTVGATFAEIMESMGIAAEIWGVHFTYQMDTEGNDYITMVKLKAQNEYSDFGKINFMLGDDGVFRNAMFRIWLKQAAKNGNDTDDGLGQSRKCTLEMLGLTETERKSAVLIPQLFNVNDAKTWISSAINDIKFIQPECDGMI